MPRRKQNMWPFGSSPKKRVRRSEAELAQIAAEHKAAESGYFGSRSGSRSSRATGGSGRGTASRSARGTTYQGYSIKRTEDGDYVIPRLDADSHFDSLSDAKAFLRSWKENGCPMKKLNPAKFDRCVREVKAKGGAYDPYAVCTAAGARNKGRKKARRNPPAEAAEAYRDFHGRDSEETVRVEKEIHYHKHLASAGKLEKLDVIARDGAKVSLSGFKGALLCFNEKRTQLYVEGGDQAVDLQEFGIDPGEAHEMEVLGEVRAVEYFTTKDHLGSEGGTAIYRHKFEKPYPELQYDVRNEQLIFSGGRYVILPEGIDK